MTRTTNKNESAAREKVRADCLKAVLDFEREMAGQRGAANVDNLPHIRSREKFEIITAVLLALGVAGMSLLGNFLVFNVVLHWTF